jgi:hypothetical protein
MKLTGQEESRYSSPTRPRRRWISKSSSASASPQKGFMTMSSRITNVDVRPYFPHATFQHRIPNTPHFRHFS